MTEEEKQAIDKLKADITIFNFPEDRIILKIIENQQKELEDMREELQMYVDIEENFDTVYMKAVADFKDKIREKFLEAKGLYERGVQPQAQYTMKLLRELLEE